MVVNVPALAEGSSDAVNHRRYVSCDWRLRVGRNRNYHSDKDGTMGMRMKANTVRVGGEAHLGSFRSRERRHGLVPWSIC
jgi:hypothetical protein